MVKKVEVTTERRYRSIILERGSYREGDGGKKPIPTAFIPKPVKVCGEELSQRKITHIDYGHKDLDVDLTNNIDLEFTKEGKIIKRK